MKKVKVYRGYTTGSNGAQIPTAHMGTEKWLSSNSEGAWIDGAEKEVPEDEVDENGQWHNPRE